QGAFMADIELRRFDLRVMRDLFAAEIEVAPLGDARFSFFGQGATVSTNMTIPTGSSTLSVNDSGALTTSSTVLVGLGPSSLSITRIGRPTSITVNNATGASISVSAGTRLILVSDPVTIYTDS